jgi:hypothetical protein
MLLSLVSLPEQVALVLIDEVHLLNERGRGAALEAGVVCRIKMVSQFPEMAGVSARACLGNWPAAWTPGCACLPGCAWLPHCMRHEAGMMMLMYVLPGSTQLDRRDTNAQGIALLSALSHS